MIGHQQIIDWRKEGKKPAAIFFEFGRTLIVSCRFDEPEQAMQFGLYPTVYVLPTEVERHQDLRFCIGCAVHVHADTYTDELLRFVEKLTAAQPKRLCVACLNDTEIMTWEGEWHAYADA